MVMALLIHLKIGRLQQFALVWTNQVSECMFGEPNE